MMKRLMACFLIIIMIFSYTVFATVDAETVADDTSAVIDFFESITQKDIFGRFRTMDAKDKMTRKDFALLVSSLIPMDMKTEVDVFVDLPDDKVYSDAINKLFNMNIISGNGNGQFFPDNQIENIQVLQILANMLGYGDYAKLKGGYPIGVIAAFRQHNVISDSYLSCDATVENILEIVKEALIANLMEVKEISSTESTYKQSDATFLSVNYDIYMAEGVLSADGTIDINTLGDVDKDIIVVDGISYACKDELIAEDLIGHNVELFYRDIDGIRESVYLFPVKNSKIVVNAEHIIGLSNNVFSYQIDDMREKKIALDSSADYIYNGVVMENLNSTLMQPDDGRITFIDNDKDSKYDVIIIEDYDSFVVASTSDMGNHKMIYPEDKFDAYPVKIDKEMTEIFDFAGNRLSISKIDTGKSITVAGITDDAKKIVIAKKIYCDVDTFTGAVKSIGKTNARSYLNISGEKYYIAHTVKSSKVAFPMSVQLEYKLDYFGKILDYTMVGDISEQVSIGYLIDAMVDTLPFETTVKIKIYTDFNKMMVYDTASRVKIDGITTRTPQIDVMNKISSSGEVVPQLVLFKLDNNGKINFLDLATPVDDYSEAYSVDNRLRVTYPKTSSLIHNKAQNILGSRIALDNNTKIMHVASNSSTAEISDYGFTSDLSILMNEGGYTAAAYSYDLEGIFADILVVYDIKNVPNVYYGVVNEIYAALHNEEVHTFVEFLRKDGTYNHPAATDTIITNAKGLDGSGTYEVTKGDLVRYYVYDNEITNIAVMFDYSDMVMRTGNVLAPETVHDRYNGIMADVYDISGNIVQLTSESLSTYQVGDVVPHNKIENRYLPPFKLYTYETGRNGDLSIRDGSIKDIRGFKNSGNDFSTVAYYANRTTGIIMVVINTD